MRGFPLIALARFGLMGLALLLSGCGNGLVEPEQQVAYILTSQETPANAPARPPSGGSGVVVGAASTPIFRLDFFPGAPLGQSIEDRKRIEWWVDESFSGPVTLQVCRSGSSQSCRNWLRIRCAPSGCYVEALQGDLGEIDYLVPNSHFEFVAIHYLPIRMKRFVLKEWAFEVLPEDSTLRMAVSGTVTWVWGNPLSN